jgi:hypothetical protein
VTEGAGSKGCGWSSKCDDEPIWHLIYWPSRQNFFLCERHRKKTFASRWPGRPKWTHEISLDCAKAGSKFDTVANRCFMPPPEPTEEEKLGEWIGERLRENVLVG